MLVEANLLVEWLERSAAARLHSRTVALKSVSGLLVAVFAVIVSPQWSKPIEASNARLERTILALDTQLHAAGLDKAQTGAPMTPQTDPAEILKKSQSKNLAFLNAASRLLNASTGSMVLNTLRFQVNAGVLQVTGQGDAADFESANEFIKRLAAIPKSRESALTSTQRSTNLGADGVAFQFQHSCQVGP